MGAGDQLCRASKGAIDVVIFLKNDAAILYWTILVRGFSMDTGGQSCREGVYDRRSRNEDSASVLDVLECENK